MSRERFMLRVDKGCLKPADEYTRRKLRERGYHTGDLLHADLAKPRNPGFHRLVHAFGQLCADNIEAFEGMDAHMVLKRIQLEGDIGCDHIALRFPGIGPCEYRIPQSLSYQSMDEGAFHELFMQMCLYISRTYWPSMSPDEIAHLAEIMPEAA